MLREKKKQAEALQEINNAEAESYEGQVSQWDSEYFGGSYDVHRAGTDSESFENTAKTQDFDNGY